MRRVPNAEAEASAYLERVALDIAASDLRRQGEGTVLRYAQDNGVGGIGGTEGKRRSRLLRFAPE